MSLTTPDCTSRAIPARGPQQGTELGSFVIFVTQGSARPPFSSGRDTEARVGHPRTSTVSSKTLWHINYQENKASSITKASHKTSTCCEENVRYLAVLCQQHQIISQQFDIHVPKGCFSYRNNIKNAAASSETRCTRQAVSATSIKSNSLGLFFPQTISPFATWRYLIRDCFCHPRQTEPGENNRHDLSTKGP